MLLRAYDVQCSCMPPLDKMRRRTGRGEQVVAASGMRGEKNRDEVGLGRSDGDDLPDELEGASH